MSPLVETQWLAENLKNPDIRIVFADNWPSEKADYDSKHIPGSVYLGVGDLMGALGNGSAPPDKAKFEAIMSKFGIRNDTHVVVYGKGGGNPFVAGAIWLMEYHGHKKVSYLNGGLAKWNKESREGTVEPAKITSTTYKAAPADESIRVDAKYVLKNLKNKNVVIVDVRPDDVYRGEKKEQESHKRAGHIPGAINMNYHSTNLNEDETFKSVKDLKAAYEAKGVTKDKEVITYCDGGVRASHSFFTLKHLLGYPNVRVYVGSWAEWANRVDPEKYPIEK